MSQIGTKPSNAKIADAYFVAFVIAVLVCFSPFKILAYGAPFLSAGWILLAGGERRVRNRALLSSLFVAIVLLLYPLIVQRFVVTGALLSLITYSTFLFLFLVPAKCLASRDLLDRMTRLATKVLVIEAIFGILQACAAAYSSGSFDLANGDAVEGTIHLGFESDQGLGNPMFAANICFILFALLPLIVKKRRSSYAPFALGGLAFVLASVMHMIIFATAGVVLSFVLLRPQLDKRLGRIQTIGLLWGVPILTLMLLSANLAYIPGLLRELKSGDHPRAEIVQRVLFEMPSKYPEMPIVGLGPGQFSSRAALISTGFYFGGFTNPRTLPFLRDQISVPSEDYLLDLWLASADASRYGDSSTAKPFFSWISIYTEFGGPVLIGIFAYVWVLLQRMKKSARTLDQKWLAVATGSGILFFLFLGFQENYWEVPQVILVGLMMVQVMYANVRYCPPVSQSFQRLPGQV